MAQNEPNLFPGIFRQPATHNVVPEENLATEVIAYFLEACEEFRGDFLKQAGVKESRGQWKVITQHKLFGRGERWDGKIPDIVLRQSSPEFTDGATVVFVEVKIDAGTTMSQLEDGSWVAQTYLYEEYLRHAHHNGRLRDWHLVTLTRWRPDRLLRTEHSATIRFTEVAKWLDSFTERSTGGTAELARQWSQFLKFKRWAMTKLERRHIDALACMAELMPRLQDVLDAAIKDATSSGEWKPKPGGRWSNSKTDDGQTLWAPPIALKRDEARSVQFGIFYGLENGKPVLRGIVLGKNIIPDDRQPGWTPRTWWDQDALCLSDVVPRVEEDTDANIWDEMKAEFTEALLKVSPPA